MHLLDKFEDHFDTRQVVRSVSHFVYELVEFVIVLGPGQSPILSSSFLDMDRALFFRTRHFTNLMSQWDFCCESRSNECAKQCNPPTDCVRRWRWCALFFLSSVWSGESWADLERLGEKWWKSLIVSDNQAETCLIITINNTSLGYLPLIINISDTCKNQTKRLDFDTINLSSLIVILGRDITSKVLLSTLIRWFDYQNQAF